MGVVGGDSALGLMTARTAQAMSERQLETAGHKAQVAKLGFKTLTPGRKMRIVGMMGRG